jgi:hypothetical protein
MAGHEGRPRRERPGRLATDTARDTLVRFIGSTTYRVPQPVVRAASSCAKTLTAR